MDYQIGLKDVVNDGGTGEEGDDDGRGRPGQRRGAGGVATTKFGHLRPRLVRQLAVARFQSH